MQSRLSPQAVLAFLACGAILLTSCVSQEPGGKNGAAQARPDAVRSAPTGDTAATPSTLAETAEESPSVRTLVPLGRCATALASMELSKDALCYLVQMQTRDETLQWLVTLTDATADGVTNSGSNSGLPSSISFYVSSGQHFEFSSVQRHLQVDTLGPWRIAASGRAARRDPQGVNTQSALTAVSRNWLSTGLAHSAEVIYERKELLKERGSFGLSFRDSEFSSEELAQGRAAAAAANLSEEDILACASLPVSLLAFFEVIQNTPGISDILWGLVDKPSLLSVAFRGVSVNFGVESLDIETADPVDWALAPDRSCYCMPLTLSINNKLGAHLQLFVTEPDPDFDKVAGVIGFTASSPKGDKRLSARLVRPAKMEAPEGDGFQGE